MGVCEDFRQNFRNTLIQNLKSEFNILSDDYWFIGIAKPTAWVVNGLTNDNAPPKNIDSVDSDIQFWRNLLSLKQIQKENVSLVVKRYDWEKGQIYSPYRDNVDLFDDLNPSKFYVLVDEERVYKCIDNNYNSQSTIAPTHTDYQIRTLSDGYRWKYLYSIPENKRQFLTKGSTYNPGYMPVEFVVSADSNDIRINQLEVQNSAINGSIDFIELDEGLKQYVISDRALFFDTGNEIVGATSAGSSSIILGGSKIVPQNNYYDGMVLSIDSGVGSGQQRVITNYTYNSNGTALVTLKNPLNFDVSGGNGATASRFSILPQVKIVGDGSSNNNTLNTYSTSAEIVVKFKSQSIPGFTGQKYIDTFELVDGGKNYSYATVSIVKGLTFIDGISANIGSLARAVISPPGGHGSNPITELGSSALMLNVEFIQDEDDSITVDNDFRQFAIIKNPVLSEKEVYLYFNQPGLTASFTAGQKITQGLTGFNGLTSYNITEASVVEWSPGLLGITATSELIVTGISGGTFGIGGIINNSFHISDIKEKTLAGSNNRITKKIKLLPFNSSSFNANGTDFYKNHVIIGIGNTNGNVSPSFSTGKVYKWEPEAGTNQSGYLYLDYSNGSFTLNEYVSQLKQDLSGLSGPKGKITNIDESTIIRKNVYNQILKLKINYDGSNNFANTSFDLDQKVNSLSGGVSVGSGYVVDWITITGGTSGYLNLIGTDGDIRVGHNLIYNNSTLTGGSISSILSRPEIKYRSGEILHIQNIRPIERNIEQSETIKIIVDF